MITTVWSQEQHNSGGAFMHFFLMIIMSILFLGIPARSQGLKREAGFNLNWKFYKGDASGYPYSVAYEDASWETVNVPHSVSYDPPTVAGEAACYEGIAWYRKTFTVPANARKVFVRFQGAMQVADVWVNGDSCGRHDNSGFTGFEFDISGRVLRGRSNTVAVRLDNRRNLDIPPGHPKPDFFLFSGLYRNVRLIFTDSIYIPFKGLKISSPVVAAASATVRAQATVNNSSADGKNCAITATVLDSSGNFVATQTAAQRIGAGSTFTFDMNALTVSDPHRWSPEKPYRYSLVTVVSADGLAVDSIVTKFGIRSLSWSAVNGFSLNDARYEIRGLCLHQTMGWIENALPDSRFAKEVEMVKSMGANAIRCTHYPRAPAFYDACDSQGVLLIVEVPTWGCSAPSYSSGFWTRLTNCAEEMVLEGYNHPSIIAWGLFNEPWADFSASIPAINSRVKALDSTRSTYIANSSASYSQAEIPDIVGLNYATTYTNANSILLNTEYHYSWLYPCTRGDSCDTSMGDANSVLADWNEIESAGPRLAGGFIWLFNDYYAWWWTNENMGLVDHLRVPKNSYFLLRQKWTGKAPDYPAKGTPTSIKLTADMTLLCADGSDVAKLIATLRDGNGSCISANREIVLAMQGPATLFGSPAIVTAAGRAGALIRSTTAPGTITVVATASGLEPDTLILNSIPVDENPYLAIAQGPQTASRSIPQLTVRSMARGYLFSCPTGQKGHFSVVTIQGKTLFSRSVKNGADLLVDRSTFGSGVFFGVWESAGQRLLARVNSVE
jgi:hypothetical protein